MVLMSQEIVVQTTNTLLILIMIYLDLPLPVGKAEAYCLGGTATSLQNVTAQTAAQMLTNWRRTGSYCPRYIHS